MEQKSMPVSISMPGALKNIFSDAAWERRMSFSEFAVKAMSEKIDREKKQNGQTASSN